MKGEIRIKNYDRLTQSLAELSKQISPTEERLVWENSQPEVRKRILSELMIQVTGSFPVGDLRAIASLHPDEKLADSSIRLIFDSLKQIKKLRLSRLPLSSDWIFEWLENVECLSLSDSPIHDFNFSLLPQLKTIFIINTGTTTIKLSFIINRISTLFPKQTFHLSRHLIVFSNQNRFKVTVPMFNL